MTDKPEYLHWSLAGGPNECQHGYAEGIPCPKCDADPKIIALRAGLRHLANLFPVKSGAVPSGRFLEEREEVAKAMIEGSEKEIERLRVVLTAALEQNERVAAELTKLRTLIDTHNDECRECPVLE